MDLVEIWHPELSRSARVPARTVRIWERSGWTRDRPAGRTKPAAQPFPAPALIADRPPAGEPNAPSGGEPTPHKED